MHHAAPKYCILSAKRKIGNSSNERNEKNGFFFQILFLNNNDINKQQKK